VSAHEDRKGLSIRAYEKGRELGKTVNNDFLPGKKNQSTNGRTLFPHFSAYWGLENPFRSYPLMVDRGGPVSLDTSW
jgi:hypothetical protein